MFDFIALDFETANREQDPCAAGIVFVKNGRIQSQEYTLINPKRKFDQICINIHGITEDDVLNAPEFQTFFEKLEPIIRHYPIVAHGAYFEKSVITKACTRHAIDMPHLTFYCTSILYQQNYPNYGVYKLDALCDRYGYSLEHHNALSDAIGCAQLMIRLLEDENTAIYPINHNSSHKNVDHSTFSISISNSPLPAKAAKECVMPNVEFDMCQIQIKDSLFVITGDIEGYSRKAIEDAITKKGGIVKTSPGKKTNYVAVGFLDPSVVADKISHKSTKILKAEALRQDGCGLRIIRLADLINILF